MAQTSSAAHEPSMEEILASIRRIIEDSDVSRHPMPAPSAFSTRGEVAKFRAPAHIQDDAPKQQIKPVLKSPIFTEEPILRGPLSEPVLEASYPDEEPDAEDDDDDFFTLNAQNDDNRSEVSEAISEPESAVASGTEIEGVLKNAHPQELSKPEVEITPSVDAEPADLKLPSADHILSEVTERKVAAAFQDLNHAVHLEPRRSFDDIASDLLRPMLQEWLDSHLPPLVERLVREEIERVVRGEH